MPNTPTTPAPKVLVPMLILAVLVAALPGLSMGAERLTPWPAAPAPQGLPSLSERLLPVQRSCCRVCSRGRACGNSCINRNYTCRQPPGCACNG